MQDYNKQRTSTHQPNAVIDKGIHVDVHGQDALGAQGHLQHMKAQQQRPVPHKALSSGTKEPRATNTQHTPLKATGLGKRQWTTRSVESSHQALQGLLDVRARRLQLGERQVLHVLGHALGRLRPPHLLLPLNVALYTHTA